MRRGGLQDVVDFVTDHNRLTLLVMLLLTGVVVAGIPMLDTESQASPDSASFEDLERVQKAEYVAANYSQRQGKNTTIATVYVRNESGNVLSKESLLAGLRYQQSIRENASVQAALHGEGAIGISNLVAGRAADGENPTLDAQIRALEAASPDEVDALVSATLASNPRAARFLPADHDPSASTAHDRRMLVTLDADASETTLAGATAALYETAKDQSTAGFFTLGDHARGDFTAHLVGEMVELILPIALLLILVVLAVSYRDLVDVVVGMTGVGLSVLWMFGIMGWLGVAAGVVSIIPVVLITGLSVDFSFHVFNRYREERGENDSIRASMNRGVRYVATALILVTVTAAIGFLANLANPLAIIRNLGLSITLGVVSALVLFTTVVPALKISIDGLLERVGLDRSKGALGRGQYLKPALAGSVRIARRAAPIALVVGFVVGGMYLLDIPLNLLTALLMSLVIGLGVDYNIHLGDRFADERQAGKDTVDALAAAVTGTGGALFGSTLTSVGAFATLLLVPDPGIQTFGTIVVLALLAAFLTAVLVLPSILALWSRVSGHQPSSDTGHPADPVAVREDALSQD